MFTNKRRAASYSQNYFYLLTTALVVTSMSSSFVSADNSVKYHTMEEVIVLADQETESRTEMSSDAKALLTIAGDIGDPLKAILALPSITFAGSDFDAPVIRGAGPSDNLYVVDGIEISNLFHELSESVIPDILIHSFDLHSGVAPVKYGTGIGGVIDLSLRDPQSERSTLVVDLGQIKSGVLFEGPISKNTAGYISYRENLARVFLTRFEEQDDFAIQKLPASRDFTARLKWVGENFSLTATSLGAYDRTKDEQLDNIGFPEGIFDQTEKRYSIANSIKLEKSGEIDMSITASIAQNELSFKDGSGSEFELDVRSKAIRSTFDYNIGSVEIEYGANYKTDNVVQIEPFRRLSDRFNTSEGFINFVTELSPSIAISVGLNASYDHYFSEASIDPRARLTIDATEKSLIFVQAGVARQRPRFSDLLEFNEIENKFTRNTAKQVGAGYRYELADNWRIQSELFYKDLVTTEFDLSDQPLLTDGEVKGVDVILSKQANEGLYGFFALTIMDSTRTPAGGNSFDYQYSSPVSSTLAINYAFGDGWNIGTKYRFQTGQVFTPAAGIAFDTLNIPQSIIYGERFSERSEDYHRWDIRLEKSLNWSFAEASAYFDILNVLDRENRSDETPNGVITSSDGQFFPISNGDSGVPLVVAVGMRLRF